MRILTIGGRGFIGSHVMAAAQAAGLEPVPLSSIRVDVLSKRPPAGTAALAEWVQERAQTWQDENASAFDGLCRSLDGADVVVNAAGLAAPASANLRALIAANAVQPGVVARACDKAGVRRLVHVSTAAVQGRRDPLDETATHAPASPYAASKAAGEGLLLDAVGGYLPPEVVLYRPASVHGVGRAVTEKLARAAAWPRLPLAGTGHQPVPATLVENVAAGIVFAATCTALPFDAEPLIVLQPDEGLTAARLVELFGTREALRSGRPWRSGHAGRPWRSGHAGRPIRLPVGAARLALAVLHRVTAPSAFLASRVRWVDLLWQGQSVAAQVLPAAGFVPPVGEDGWRALAEAVRAGQR